MCNVRNFRPRSKVSIMSPGGAVAHCYILDNEPPIPEGHGGSFYVFFIYVHIYIRIYNIIFDMLTI